MKRKKEPRLYFNPKESEEITKECCNFICNFLDFLNHPDVEIKVIKYPELLQESRIKKGRLPIPDIVEINLKGKLYNYIYEELPKQERDLPSHSFWVRGHYMHFWNKKKYRYIYRLGLDDLKEKGYQIDEQGIISKWVLPYTKGKGLLINKDYKLK